MHQSKVQGRVDPIELLRNCFLNNKKVKLKDNYLIFDKQYRLNLKTQTPWLSPLTNNQYNLGSLWLFLQHKKNNITDYIGKVSELGLRMVSTADQSQIIKYFIEGTIKQTNSINQELKVSLAQKNLKRDQPSSGFQHMDQEGGMKKVKLDQQTDPDLQVIDYLSRFQKPVMTKTRSLRFPEKSFEGIIKSLFQNQQKVVVNQQPVGKTVIGQIQQKKKNPVIIVPQNNHVGNVGLNNIEKLLVNGQYDQKMEPLQSHIRKTTFEYQIRGKRVTFEVTNNPSLMATTDWDNVVAIFVQGRKNEFANWPIRDPAQLFKRAKGFLVKYKNSRTEDANDWNVRTLIVQKLIRFRDIDIKNYIWNQIQNHLFSKV